jgi:GTPase SAR1 family protein
MGVESLNTKNIQIISWDLGGSDQMKLFWRYYYAGTYGMIFVVNASERKRIEIL